MGWVALEEYGTRKVLVDEAAGRTHRHGRCDLYVRKPDGHSFAFEAKQVMAPAHALPDAITEALAHARSDASVLHRDEASARFALVFAAPAFRAGADVDIEAELIALNTNILQGSRRLTHAYAYPAETRRCHGPAGEFIWPGVMAIVQKIHRGK